MGPNLNGTLRNRVTAASMPAGVIAAVTAHFDGEMPAFLDFFATTIHNQRYDGRLLSHGPRRVLPRSFAHIGRFGNPSVELVCEAICFFEYENLIYAVVQFYDLLDDDDLLFQYVRDLPHTDMAIYQDLLLILIDVLNRNWYARRSCRAYRLVDISEERDEEFVVIEMPRLVERAILFPASEDDGSFYAIPWHLDEES